VNLWLKPAFLLGFGCVGSWLVFSGAAPLLGLAMCLLAVAVAVVC
jgi:hypothetical protein